MRRRLAAIGTRRRLAETAENPGTPPLPDVKIGARFMPQLWGNVLVGVSALD